MENYLKTLRLQNQTINIQRTIANTYNEVAALLLAHISFFLFFLFDRIYDMTCLYIFDIF